MVNTVHEWTDYSTTSVAAQKQRIARRFRQRLSRELKTLKESDEYQHADDAKKQDLEDALRSHISQDRLTALVEVNAIVMRHRNPVGYIAAATATPTTVPDPSVPVLPFSTAVEATRAANDALHFTIEEQSLAESIDLEKVAGDTNKPDDWDRYYNQLEAATKKARVKRYNGALDRAKGALIEANIERLYRNGQGALAERSWAEVKQRGGISQVDLAANFPEFANTIFAEGEELSVSSNSEDEADDSEEESDDDEEDEEDVDD